MKKDRTALGYSGKKCTVFLLIAALLCVYLPLTAAAAPDAALVKIVETVFEDGEGQEIYEFQPGVVRAVTYMTAEQAGTVRYAAAVYGANKMLKEISYSSAEVLKGANVLRSDYITAGSGDEVRLLLWDGDLRPAERASVLGEAGAKAVSSATVTVNGSMYQGNVNRVKRTVTVDIPVGISADESAVQTAQSWLKSAQVRLSGQWSAIAPAAQGNYDLSAPMRFTLSDAQGETAEYTLTARIVRYSRAYDVTGAAIQGEDSSQWNNKYRVGAPAYIISEANKGNGVWFLSGATVEGANANAVSIKQENGNDYINISKQPGSFELWSSGTVENTREFATEFRFRINSQEGGTSAGDFMQVWSGNVDDVVFSRRGDCFVVGHRNNNDSGIAYVPGVQLGFGEWHTLRYVFKKAAQPAPDMEYDAYSMELYLDGKMIDEYCHGVAAANAQYAGRLSYANVTGASFPYIAFNPFSAVTIDMDIDDVLCTHVPLSSDVSVTDAEVSIGGKVYQADVNPVRKTITVDALTQDLTAASLASAEVTIHSPATVSPEANGTITDLNSAKSYTLTAEDGKTTETYTLRVEASELMRGYDAEGASLNASGYPDNSADETGGLASDWTRSGGNAAYAIANEEDNSYIQMTGSSQSSIVGSILNSSAVPPAGTYHETLNGYIVDKFAMELRFRVERLPEANDDLVRISAGHLDQVVLRRESADSYSLWKKDVTNTGMTMAIDYPALKAGSGPEDWHTLRYVFRRYGPISGTDMSWYAVELYIDGKYVTELNQGAQGITDPANWHYTGMGRFTNALGNYAQLKLELVSAFSGGVLGIDDFRITFMTDWDTNYTGPALTAQDFPVAVLRTNEGEALECAITLDSESGEALVNIPYTTAAAEKAAIDGKGWPEIYPDTSKAVLMFPEGMRASLDGGEESSALVCDLTHSHRLEITASGRSVSYELAGEFTELSAEYHADGATVTENVPQSGGGASWAVAGGGAAVTAPNGENGAGGYIQIDKSAGETFQLYSTALKGAESNKKIQASFLVNVDSVSSQEIAAFSAAGADWLTFERSGDGTFQLAVKSSAAGEATALRASPQLETGKWHRIDYAFTKAGGTGYLLKIYANGAFAGSVVGNTPLTGSMAAAETPQFAVLFSEGAAARVKLDDVTVTSVNDLTDGKNVVHVLGDSICQYYGYDQPENYEEGNRREGWGRYFAQSFTGDVVVLNHARSGYNTNIYLTGTERAGFATRERWSSIKGRMKEGDYLIIALAWNELNTVDGTQTEEAYTENMNRLISEAKALGVTPLLVTPTVAMSRWDDTESIPGTTIRKAAFNNTYAQYADYVKKIADAHRIVCLDLNTELWENTWTDAYHRGSPVTNNDINGWNAALQAYETCFVDTTHVTRDGAQIYNDALCRLLAGSESPLKYYLRSR